MAEATYVLGKMVGATFDGRALYCSGGNSERSVSLVQLGNSREGGYQVVAPGRRSSRGTLTLLYDGADPPSIREGDYGELVIDANGSGSAPESHPGGRLMTIRILVVSINDSWTSDGEYHWTLSYQSSGAYSVVEPDPAGGGGA